MYRTHTLTCTRFPVKLRPGGVYKVCGREQLYILALILTDFFNLVVESQFGRIVWKNGDILAGKVRYRLLLCSLSEPIVVFTQQLQRRPKYHVTGCWFCHDEKEKGYLVCYCLWPALQSERLLRLSEDSGTLMKPHLNPGVPSAAPSVSQHIDDTQWYKLYPHR